MISYPPGDRRNGRTAIVAARRSSGETLANVPQIGLPSYVLQLANARLIRPSRNILRIALSMRPNENKMSDGWRDGASLRVEGGISWESGTQAASRSLHRMVRPSNVHRASISLAQPPECSEWRIDPPSTVHLYGEP